MGSSSSLYQNTSQVPVGVTVVVGPQGDSGFAVPIQTVTGNGALSISYEAAKHCHVNVTGDITSFEVTDWPASGNFARLTVEFHNTGAYGVTFPDEYKWSGGHSVPQLTGGADTEDWFAFTTTTGGNTVTGHYVGDNYA